MAETISTIAADCGATVTCEAGPREISLDVATPDGLQVCVEFDGRSLQPNIYVLSWHMDFKSSKRLNPDTFGGNVNTCHFKKATYVAYGFEDLCDQFTFGLLLAKDGRAFLPEVERLAA
ncbi:MAG: hypothetical protein Q7S87_01315 [Agitococcus sp.]|nr:hypothetical protein [Agitococcus sp.]MDO9179165.1 hypothetical protein [Agitococcus sp.]